MDSTIEEAIALLRELSSSLLHFYNPDKGRPPHIDAVERVCADLSNTFLAARDFYGPERVAELERDLQDAGRRESELDAEAEQFEQRERVLRETLEELLLYEPLHRVDHFDSKRAWEKARAALAVSPEQPEPLATREDTERPDEYLRKLAERDDWGAVTAALGIVTSFRSGYGQWCYTHDKHLDECEHPAAVRDTEHEPASQPAEGAPAVNGPGGSPTRSSPEQLEGDSHPWHREQKLRPMVKGTRGAAIRRGEQMADYRWWCSGCSRYTEKAPCEHCSAGHDEVLIIEPGQTPPHTEAEWDGWPTVDDFEWPEEAYVDGA